MASEPVKVEADGSGEVVVPVVWVGGAVDDGELEG